MGAFCVFGISRAACLVQASKLQPTFIPGAGGRHYTVAEWAQLRNQLAEELFQTSTKIERISPELDAPQLCQDWIDVNPDEVRNAKIMVRGGQGRQAWRAGAAQWPAGDDLAGVHRAGGCA
ncbi:hypothetical protein ACLB1G_21820 [Oxalobacteraceae bacterium A2-2]